jgi:hypothetical protein
MEDNDGDEDDLLASNQGVGYSMKIDGAIEDDWSEEFDDKDSAYWEDHLGGPDDSVTEEQERSYSSSNVDFNDASVNNPSGPKNVKINAASNNVNSNRDINKSVKNKEMDVGTKKLKSDLQIGNCILEYSCNMKIEDMDDTYDEGIKFCQRCKREVHICHTIHHLGYSIVLNRCVAFSRSQLLKEGSGIEDTDDIELGMPF